MGFAVVVAAITAAADQINCEIGRLEHRLPDPEPTATESLPATPAIQPIEEVPPPAPRPRRWSWW